MELSRESTRGHAPFVLMVVILSAPVLAPDTGAWHGMRPFLIQWVAFGSLALLLAQVRWSLEGIRSFLTTGPNLALVLFVGWTALSFALTAPAGGRGRAIALAELMRMASGVAIYLAVVYRCNSRDHLKAAVLLLLVGGVLASAAGMLSAGISKSDGVTAAYGNRQLLAAFLVLLLPVAIVFAQTGEKFSRPLFASSRALRCLLATVATVMLVAAILLTNNRSSWFGSVIGLLVITALLVRARKPKEVTTRKHHWIASPIVVSGCFILFLILMGTESGVIERAKTLTAPAQVSSFEQRLQLWSICARMIRTRPLMGFGIGSFPMKAGEYSGTRAERKDEQTVTASGAETIGVPSAAQVEKEGASLSSLPHNEYLQLAAEQGLIGLALYLAVLVSFFYRGIRALPDVAKLSRTRKLMLIASMGAIAAQCVDAIGNPGWRFGDVSPLFWLMLGIGIAATRTHDQRGLADAKDRITLPRLLRSRLSLSGWQATSVLLGLTLMVLFFVVTVSARSVRSGLLIALYNPGGGDGGDGHDGGCPPPPTCPAGQHYDPITCECVPGGGVCTLKLVSVNPDPACIGQPVTFTVTQEGPGEISWSAMGGSAGPGNPVNGGGMVFTTSFSKEGNGVALATCNNSTANGTARIFKVEKVVASFSNADNSPQEFFPEEKLDDPCDPKKPGKALTITYDKVSDQQGVKPFDIDLTAIIKPEGTIPPDGGKWSKLSGPDSGTFSNTTGLRTKYQNPKQGGVYKFQYELRGCKKIVAVVNLPLAGPEIESYVSEQLTELAAYGAIFRSQYPWHGLSPIKALRKFAQIGASFDYTGQATVGSSPCKGFQERFPSDVKFNHTISGVVVEDHKLSNFLIAYFARECGFEETVLVLGGEWNQIMRNLHAITTWRQIAQAVRGEDQYSLSSSEVGFGLYKGESLKSVMAAKGRNMQAPGVATKSWPSIEPSDGTGIKRSQILEKELGALPKK